MVCVLGRAGASLGADAYDAALDRHFATGPRTNSDDSAVTSPLPAKVADLESALLDQVKVMARGPQVAPPPPPRIGLNPLGVWVALSLLAFIQLLPFLNRHLNPWSPSPATKADAAASLMQDDPALAEFFSALQAGPGVHAAGALVEAEPVASAHLKPSPDRSEAKRRAWIEDAFKQVAGLRSSFAEIARAVDDNARRTLYLELARQIHSLAETSKEAGFIPLWQMNCALEGLLKQLTSKTSNSSPSALRTLAGAVDLLEALCDPGLSPDLVTDPPVRLLAVDDDPISRRAIGFALKKAFQEPDLAAEGSSALMLAAQHKYDVIFLDVEMPAMDGFELCSRLKDSALNGKTPTVFVTVHSDFNSRAKSAYRGGQELIAKPFLSFEITVKALTLVLRRRLGAGNRIVSGGPAQSAPNNELAAPQRPNDEPRGSSPAAPALPPSTLPKSAAASAHNGSGSGQGGTGQGSNGTAVPGIGDAIYPLSQTVPLTEDTAENSPVGTPLLENGIRRFSKQGLAQLEAVKEQLVLFERVQDSKDRQEPLVQLHSGIRSLVTEAERREMAWSARVGNGLASLFKKLIEHPKLSTSSATRSAAAAIDLLEDLCAGEAPQRGLAYTTARILVVDDDAVARRAISGAVQLAFGKPHTVASGEEAVALATENAYDVIFLDVLMPGMDGLEACSKIHETSANRQTPIVFVTSASDTKTRALASSSGGCAFIPKPVLASEITLVTLTFIVRSRLAKPAATADGPSGQKDVGPGENFANVTQRLEVLETFR